MVQIERELMQDGTILVSTMSMGNCEKIAQILFLKT
jgi:hypothetical protein